MRILLAVLFLAALPASARLPASLSLDATGHPVAHFEFPPGADELRFAPDASGRNHRIARESWSYDKSCFTLERDRLRRRAPECGDASVRLEWDGRMVDRMYPPVIRLENGGVLVFTEYLRMHEPGIEDDLRGWAYLGPDEYREEKAGRVLVDRGVPSEIERELLGTAPRLLEFLQERLGTTAVRPTLYLTWTQRRKPGREVQADVVPGVIRFGLAGREWDEVDEKGRADFRFLVAHELVHLWNSGEARPAAWAAPWMVEGSAELLAVAALLGIGALDARGAADRIDAAINECTLWAAGRAWPRIRERDGGRVPYACGMAMQFAMVAAAREAAPGIDAPEFWRRAWRRWPRYFEAVGQMQLEDVGAREAASRLHEMLTLDAVPLTHSLRALLRAAAVPFEPATATSSALSNVLRGHALMALMQADCGGNAGFFMRDDHLLTAELTCGKFRGDMRIRQLEGHDLIEAPADAIRAARAACRERKSTRVGAMDHTSIDVACSEADLPDLDALVRIEPRYVAAMLLGGRVAGARSPRTPP